MQICWQHILRFRKQRSNTSVSWSQNAQRYEFVFQTCQEGKLSCLDTQVAVKDNKITTSIYRKPTSTGVLINFNSCVPQSWKISQYPVLQKPKSCLRRSTTYRLEKFKKLLIKNSFSTKFVDEQIQKKNNF